MENFQQELRDDEDELRGEVPSLVDADHIVANSRTFNKKFINGIRNAIDEAHTFEDLISLSIDCFNSIVHLINTVPNTLISREIQEFTKSIKEKIQTIGSDDTQKNELYQQIWKNMITIFSEVINLKLTTNAGLTILRFIEGLIDDKVSTYDDNLINIIIQAFSPVSFLGQNKTNKITEYQIFIGKSQIWFDKIAKLINFNADNFQNFLQSHNNPIKFVFLTCLYKKHQNKNIEGYILEKFKDFVLNDKEKQNHNYFKYFVAFLNGVDQQLFVTEIFSHIEFMMKRNNSLLELIAQTINELKLVKITPKELQMLTQDVLTDEFLINDDTYLITSIYIKNLSLKLENQSLVTDLIVNFLLKRFIETKKVSSIQIQHRQKIFKQIKCAIQHIKSELVSQEAIEQVSKHIVEHFFQNKDELILKEIFEDAVFIMKFSSNFDHLIDILKNLIGKPSTSSQFAIFNELMISKQIPMTKVLEVLQQKSKQLLSNENLSSTSNYSSVLVQTSFNILAYENTKEDQYKEIIFENKELMQYFTTNKGYVNTLPYFKKNPSSIDIKCHLEIIKYFLILKYQGQQQHEFSDVYLRDSLCEYLLNENYTFREFLVFTCFDKICTENKLSKEFVSNFLQSLFVKIKQVSLRVKDENFKENLAISYKLKFILKTLFQNIDFEITSQDFIELLRIMSFPYVSKSQHDLFLLQEEVDKILKQKQNPFQYYFDQYTKNILDYALYDRTGILSPNKTLNEQGINMLVLLGIYGKLSQFISGLVTILNYKPLELVTKLDKIFQKEFDRISYYDLMYYSEMSKELLNVFNSGDQSIQQKELSIEILFDGQVKQQNENDEEEKGSEEIDASQLIAQSLKKAQAQKKVQKPVSKKGQTVQQSKQTTQKSQPQQKEKKSEQKGQEIQSLSKEQRNQMDRHQIINYLEDISKIQGKHIESAQEVIKKILKWKGSSELNYLDLILHETLQCSIKLLNFPASRFSTLNYLTTLFSCDQTTPFFKVKQSIVNSIIAISQNKMFQKNMREFQAIFQHLDNEAQFDHMDKGYLQLILTMANFVLKDLQVHLSVKEQALNVTSNILDRNNKVQNFDLVKVTINMMKSSYVNDNLSNYLSKLMKKINKEELALILQRIFEYEPIPKTKLLQELLKYQQPLFCPVWLTSQLWILQYDDENGKLAKQLWNKYQMVLRNDALDLQKKNSNKNIFYYLESSNTNIFESSIRAIVAAIQLEQFHNRFDLIIDDLIEFYQSKNTFSKALEQQLIESAEGSKKVAIDEGLNRIAMPEILKRSAQFVQANSFKKIFEFFITQGCLDSNEDIAKCSMQAAIKIIQAKGQIYSEEILKLLDKYIHEGKNYTEYHKNQAIIMIGFLADYLDKSSQKKLLGTFEKMLELLHTPSELIRQSICKCISQLARFFEDKSKKFLDDNLTVLRQGTDEKTLRGSAYAVAGIIKGLGYMNNDLLDIVQKECFTKNADSLRKLSGLYLYETLSISLGKQFEMKILVILPNILSCISDQKDIVRKTALQTNKTIMSKFSNYAIKKALPVFLKNLENENWRQKLASVEALGNMAYCAPRQIAGFLPDIVKGIREVLNDTHEKVHAAALQAIHNIGSVIKCPEIADILDDLIKALSNPNQYLTHALQVLLDTSFVHAIDAPSLSLLVPILDSGLMMHDNQSKQLASTLMGNICNLTQDPEDLIPYMKILMPAIKNSLFDSIPEIRASAAKALGSLCKGLGLENSLEMLQWMRSVLHQKGLATSERSGAAQGFAEIISVHGPKFFAESIKEVVEKAKYQDAQIRESFRGVMLFLPTSFDQFVKYLAQLLPLMIEGLSDEVEEVRKVSLRNVKICIKQFGKIAPNWLVHPIMKMMFDKDFRVRQSSSVLMYQLVKELENDIIKSQPKYISNETKHEILSSMFILKYDTVEKVSIQASQIWKNIVDNQLNVLRQVISDLIKLCFDIIQSDSLELQEMGLNCMRGLVEKFGEKLVSQSLDILENYLEKATGVSQILGISKTIMNMTAAAPIKLLHELRNRFISIIDSNLSHEIEEIRNLSAKVFITIFIKTYEQAYMNQTLDKSILKKLHLYVVNKKFVEADYLIESLKYMLKNQGADLKLEDKLIHLTGITNLEAPLSIAQSKVIKALAPLIAQTLFKRKLYLSVLESLVKELQIDIIDDDQRLNEVLLAYSELISNIPEEEMFLINEQISDFYQKCKEKNRLGLYVDLISYYCQNSKKNYENYANEYMRNILVLMNEQNDVLLEKVNNCLNSIYDGLPKESQFYLVPLVKQIIQDIAVQDIKMNGIYKKKIQTLKLFEKPSGVKSFVAVIQNSIMHGSIDIRIDSATCFKYLIDFSKPEAIKGDIIKICGALIRVVNDKFTSDLKIQIFFALKFILLKASATVKAMVPQLQTTFLKAFNDQLGNPQLRKLVIENLLLLVKITPKVDPIVKELVSLLEGDKLDKESKIEVAEALAIIIKIHGKSIQQTMAQQILGMLEQIIVSKKQHFNDKSLVSCAVSYAFLSYYSLNAQQIEDLFNKYDQNIDLRICLGIKFGILMHQNQNQQKLLSQLEQYLVEQLKTASGLEEMGGYQWVPYDSTTPENLTGRLFGSVEIIGYIGDIFIRRFGVQNSEELFNIYYNSILTAQIFEQINSKKALSGQTIKSLLFYLQSIPVKQIKQDKFEDSLARVLKLGFEFIHNFYLEFGSKKNACPALLNMLMLNYDNFLDVDDDSKIQVMTQESVKEIASRDYYQKIVDSDMKMIASELVLLQ